MSDGFGLIKGLKVTFKELFRKSVTDKYPKEFREKPQRFHGRHVLNKYEDGMEKCIGCELCAGVCPAQCIYVRGEDNPEDNPVSPGERYGFIYEINMLRCIYCALCVEACPTEAITMTSLFEMSVANRSEAIFDKEVLVVKDDGTPNTHEEQTKLTNFDDLNTSEHIDFVNKSISLPRTYRVLFWIILSSNINALCWTNSCTQLTTYTLFHAVFIFV